MNTNFKTVNVEDIEVGNSLVNLGEVLEVEEQEFQFSLVISRNNEKQVFKFTKEQELVIHLQLT